jgi:hypothetical protein
MRAAIICAALALAMAPAAAMTKKFDGVWAIDVKTTVGECEPRIAGTVTIEDGQVVASSGEQIGVWGYVEDNGTISTRFTQGQAMLRANGTAKGAKASGAWSSNTNYCGGTWSALREK